MTDYNIEITNEYPDWDVDIEQIRQIAIEIIEQFSSCGQISANWCLNGYEYKTLSFGILFCDGIQTRQINHDYRGRDYPADIITFALFADSDEDERFIPEFEINLGEIIIALDKVSDSAAEKNIDKNIELKFLISHGIMHLLGFDHQTEEEFEFVIKQQKQALERMGIKYDKI